MLTSYAPRAGTIPARVIQHLTAKGGKINAAQIAQLFGANPASVATLLKLSVEAGLLNASKAGVAYEWSLPDGVVTQSAMADPADQLVITAWPDGEITLKGYTPNADDGITLSPGQIARIAMHRPGARVV